MESKQMKWPKLTMLFHIFSNQNFYHNFDN